ncbi:MAG: prolyl oligopeptidase family serine peptidase [Hydrotalea sp.]|nr:prolyl oligopeptidase family serine peptidase [Hydrotalea sp.]
MAIVLFACKNEPPMHNQTLSYPKTVQDTTVEDNYFGTVVKDPYRWLEDDTSAATEAWVKQQNELTLGYLKGIPFREEIAKRYSELFNYTRYTAPYRLSGNQYLYTKNDGLQNQAVYYIQDGLEGKPEVFLDPNQLSKDGTVTAGLAGLSKDKKYMAIAINRAGSDWQEMEVMEVATKKKMTDQLKWLKFSGASWRGDGFYYSRYDAPADGKALSAKNSGMKVYYHRLGDPQEKDELIYQDPANPLRYYWAHVTEDERFLILSISEGTDGTELWYRDFQQKDAAFKKLFKGFSNNYTVLDNLGDQLLVYHNQDAPNYKVSLVDPSTGKMQDFIAEKSEKLESASIASGKLFLTYLKDACSKVYQYSLPNGKLDFEVNLPGLGTAYGFDGNKDDAVLFYSYTSFTVPNTIYQYNPANGESKIFQQAAVKFNPADYETKQVFVTSTDGAKVPMFITHKKGLKLDGKAPTLLYGYGGFNVSLTPSFSTSNLILLEKGGVYAMANLRGGGEYGEAWHKAGMLDKKQQVFDDFIACGEFLKKEGYTSTEYLAIEGGSNGGLLVGAVMTQQPNFCKVAFPAVGVLDMLRYHKFTVGWGWVVEYGSSEQSKESFENLYRYSPLHNLKAGVSYPATLITTADHDDRVVPAHSFKFAATLQEKHKGQNPVLIRIETSAGHGAGKPTAKIIEEQADKWSFLFYNTGSWK